MPLPSATDDHQTANARQLVEAGAAIRIPESKLSIDDLTAAILAILDNPDGALHMTQAALAVSKPGAAEELAALVQYLAHGEVGDHNGGEADET